MKKLDSLKSGKSAGPDNISWKLLKLAGPTIVSPLDGLYTRSLRECRVFNRWKLAHLSPIFKKDDELEIGNYRPIFLLSIPSKILESCVSDTVVSHVFGENECLATDHQWAFRKGYSTELLLTHLMETWRHALDADRVVGAVFVDFRKAFDSVSHSTLITKLYHQFGITGNLLLWLQDYLMDRAVYGCKQDPLR